MSTNISCLSSHPQWLLEQRSTFGSLSFISDWSTLQDQSYLPQVTPATTLPQHHDAFTAPPMELIKLQFQLPPKSVIFLELKNPFMEAFTNQELSNRGFVSQHYSFYHAMNTWHSPLCSRSFQFQGEKVSLDQCSNGKTNSRAVTMKNFPSMHLASTIEALYLVCSLEQIKN